MGKIAIYTRVSSAKQAAEDRYSLAVQKEKCIYYLKSQGYKEEDMIFFEDAGISGTTIEQRDELKELLRQIQEPDSDIEGICCYDLSRISRSISHTLDIFKLLKENQLKLYTVDGAFQGDINSQTSKIMISIHSMLNELFIDQLRERVKAGLEKSVQNGNYFGGPAPLGYRYEFYSTNQQENKDFKEDKKTRKKDIKKRLVVDENEKPVIELIFHLFTNEKYSIKNVAQYLNLHGYKTRQNKQFATATVQKILENPIYCGRLFWAKRRQKKKTDRGVRIWEKTSIYDINFYDLPRGNHQPIISEEFFLETLERLRGRRKVRRNLNMAEAMSSITKQEYFDAHKKVFINILRCPNCGGKMTSSLQPSPILSDGTRKPAKVYYKCSTYNAGKNLCDGYYSVQEEKVFNLIKEDFFTRLKEAFTLVKEYQNYLKEQHGANEEMLFDKEINKIKDEIKNLEKNESKLLTKLDNLINIQLEEEKGSLKYNRIEKMIKETEKEIEEVKEFQEELQNRIIQAIKRREALLSEAKEQEEFENIEEYFNSLPLLQKRQLLEKVYSKIVIGTVSNARYGPKRLTLKEVEYNQYSNIYGLCKVLGVQDFKSFNEYLKSKGRKELNLLLQHYGDIEEYVKDIEKQNVSSKFKEYISELQKEVENDEDREFMDDFINRNMNLDLQEFEEKFAEEYRKYREQKEKELCGVLN
ncbi:Site-specific DNA recombinase [Caloramator quimbayensis]|uniref:Site-specific DNA recombinase n=1 Tax=Caloramator quimbayensis TaxID=1147123 RepID=A0A1T4Y598_9CLOT|nr:recombinase family protein [Caloramator quimbayensis]SKA96987.1 Site-specific DNA recombinase [Caloramator quimbayensis]